MTFISLYNSLSLKHISNQVFPEVGELHPQICVNESHTLDINFRIHRNEEADTQIPLHVLHSLKNSTYKHFDIYSVDDVLVLLMDLVS